MFEREYCGGCGEELWMGECEGCMEASRMRADLGEE